jgi:hypothetical protein
MNRGPKPHDQITHAAALQHAILSLVLLGIITVSLFQITHLLTAKRESVPPLVLTSQN